MASITFILPTRQCNALVMGPGGCSVKGFIEAGGILTVLFLLVALGMLNLILRSGMAGLSRQ